MAPTTICLHPEKGSHPTHTQAPSPPVVLFLTRRQVADTYLGLLQYVGHSLMEGEQPAWQA